MIKRKMQKTFSALVKSTFTLFSGMMAGSIFNYFFTLIMGRMLGPSDYGVLIALFSLFYIISVPSATIQTVAMKFTSFVKNQGALEKITSLLLYLTKRVFWLGLVSFFIFAILSKPIASYLKIDSPYLVILTMASLLFIFLLPINRGILQGLQNFKGLSINSIIDPLFKLILGVILVFLGLKVFGALLGLIFGIFFAYVFSFIPLKNILKKREKEEKPKGLFRYTGWVFLAMLLITLASNLDILLIKHFWDGEEAGLYAALSMMGKIILFISLPVVSVMFPMISDLYERKERHYLILINSFVLVVALGAAVLAIYIIAPGLSVKILYGTKYLKIAPYLGLFGFAILLYALINVFVNYYLSVKNFLFLIPITLFLTLEVILLWFFHDSFFTIIRVLIAVFAFGLGLLGFLYIYPKRKKFMAFLKGQL